MVISGVILVLWLERPKLSFQQCGNQEDNLYFVFIHKIVNDGLLTSQTQSWEIAILAIWSTAHLKAILCNVNEVSPQPVFNSTGTGFLFTASFFVEKMHTYYPGKGRELYNQEMQ